MDLNELQNATYDSNILDLNILKNKAYQTAKKHGWHDEAHSGDHWAMLIISEIGEAIQADRCEKYADLDGYKKTYNEFAKCSGEQLAANIAYDFNCKNTFEDELADICIRTLDMAGVYAMDLTGYESSILDFNDCKPRLKRISEMSVSEWSFDTTSIIIHAIEDDICKGDFYNILRQVFQLAEVKDINLQWFIENKMSYNESRSYRHGGKKY